MSGLELPAFIVGLGGLIAVFEKGFEVWRVIQRAEGFGDDVAEWMCKLEMEFLRFQTWWTALEHLTLSQRSSRSLLNVPLQTSPLQMTLTKQFGNPIVDAATSVLKLLEKVEGILQRNGVLIVVQSQPPVTSNSVDLEEETSKARQRLKAFANDLLKRTSWTTRIKHSTSPWKDDSDKAALDNSLDSIIYWNNTLYSILPQNLRDSILQLGIAGYALNLDTPDNINDISNLSTNRNGTLSQSAKLMALRQRFREEAPVNRDLDAILNKMEQKVTSFKGLDQVEVYGGCQYSIVDYSSEDGKFRVLIEWIPYPKGTKGSHESDLVKRASKRLSQISYTLKQVGQLSPLQALPSLGFVEFKSACSFGLVSALPPSVTSSPRVVTLYDMLPGVQQPATADKSKNQGNVKHALPTLNQRLQLASKLAMGFYTFLLTRWHHERFSSLHIAFLVDEAAALTSSEPATPIPLDLNLPIIGGFAISRPDSPAELSISALVDDVEAVYLHPEVRQRLRSETAAQKQNGERERYQRIHDIYALGLLLVEIGFWKRIARLVDSRSGGRVNANPLSPNEFKKAIIKKTRSEMAFWMGETYRDVTLRCLLAGEPGGVQAEDSAGGLNNFYWDVGINLMNS
ncbi:hypothetical protein FSARC_10501 [Fusarium sarcochroum]|uniref:Prion-inhibition and propagation HeLo domain-containing protein n=1 Tax=Fusarium sarcochroum TaxID=1208366 RepID=A0A8H4X446_9HYPO|nr:hypothetical protein FSARC_10501 [Fusarium sarcochroum]